MAVHASGLAATAMVQELDVVGVHFQLESAPVIGVALEPAREGRVRVLINP